MNNWQETAEIFALLERVAASGGRAALATVIAIEGSAYRRPGAKLLITDSGSTLGSVSGGCLEADVREIALGVMASGRPRRRRYETGSAHEDIVWGLGLGCDGRVEVFVQPAAPGPLLDLAPRLRELLRGEEPFTLATRLPRAGAKDDPDAEGAAEVRLLEAVSGAGGGSSKIGSLGDGVDGEFFLDRMTPPHHLVVCGAGDDAQALVESAAGVGLRVTVVDHRAALATTERFPRATQVLVARPESAELRLPPAARSLAVVQTHSFSHDRDWAKRLLTAGVPFVGILGPRARCERIRAEIGAENDPRIFGPVGLDLGAEGARQIAISIVSQLLAFLGDREPRPLSERTEAIHAL